MSATKNIDIIDLRRPTLAKLTKYESHQRVWVLRFPMQSIVYITVCIHEKGIIYMMNE